MSSRNYSRAGVVSRQAYGGAGPKTSESPAECSQSNDSWEHSANTLQLTQGGGMWTLFLYAFLPPLIAGGPVEKLQSLRISHIPTYEQCMQLKGEAVKEAKKEKWKHIGGHCKRE